MEYLYAPKEDYTFLAGGNVIKHFSGMPSFPVRLTLELFERAYRCIGKEKIALYDPCCGSGFSLTVLGMIEQDKIAALYGSDVEPACVEAASCNVSLVKREGLLAAREKLLSKEETSEERRSQLAGSVDRVLPYLVNPAMHTAVFRHDILDSPPSAEVLPEKIDCVFADIPYGSMTEWKTAGSCPDPAQTFLENISELLSETGVLILCGTKALKIGSEGFRRRTKFSVGKRLVYFLEK